MRELLRCSNTPQGVTASASTAPGLSARRSDAGTLSAYCQIETDEHRRRLARAAKEDLVEPASSMLSAQADLERLTATADRRPYFCAAALTRRFRAGLLMITLLAEALLFFVVLTIAVTPNGLTGLVGALLVGGTLVLTFLVFLLFGALAGNNTRLSANARVAWYASFLLAGPIAIPYYWRIHVWPVPFEPLD